MKIEVVTPEEFAPFVNKVNEIAEVLNAVNIEAARKLAATEEKIEQLERKLMYLEARG